MDLNGVDGLTRRDVVRRVAAVVSDSRMPELVAAYQSSLRAEARREGVDWWFGINEAVTWRDELSRDDVIVILLAVVERVPVHVEKANRSRTRKTPRPAPVVTEPVRDGTGQA
ncbi:hypothetical protein GCM10009765_60010 [Fodinicola feengrottensis]|uniref:Uncharacterized protein n=1 Tax=Fodinicola feengrottensis TaxID=435914 RepID=A0ABP4UCL8_9ACTN